jgi:short-subunit dehydrogenase
MKVIITGASKGIGKAAALLMAEKGAELAVCARGKDSLEELITAIRQVAPDCKIHSSITDVSDKAAVQQFGAFCLASLGTPDVLINNAGVFYPGQLHSEPEGALEQMIQTNLFSAYYLSRIIIPAMKNAKSGHIMNICSVASIMAYSNGGAYSVSKYALYGLSRNLREELKPFGIRVTSILPGATYTASWEGAEIPEERFMPAEDIAAVIWQAIALSERTVMEDIILRPQLGDL